MTPQRPLGSDLRLADAGGRAGLLTQLTAEYPGVPGTTLTRVVNRAYLGAKSVTSGEENIQIVAEVLARDRLRLIGPWLADQYNVASEVVSGAGS